MIILTSLFLLISCQAEKNNQENIEKETIESFTVEESELNSEGIYVPIGYKKVNAITYVKDNKHVIKTHVRTIEDFYDLEENFVKTIITNSYYEKLKINHSETSYNKNHEVSGPLTIHAPDKNDKSSIAKLNSEELEEVRNHVVTIIENYEDELK